jgi:hypothetical protein
MIRKIQSIVYHCIAHYISLCGGGSAVFCKLAQKEKGIAVCSTRTINIFALLCIVQFKTWLKG